MLKSFDLNFLFETSRSPPRPLINEFFENLELNQLL